MGISMKTARHLCLTLLALLLGSVTPVSLANENRPQLNLAIWNAGLELSWPGTIQNDNGVSVQPYFELQRTLDLQNWEPIAERQRANSPGQVLRALLQPGQPCAFYRLLVVHPPKLTRLGEGGAELFGYADAFARELDRIGQISPEQFRQMFPEPTNYLAQLSGTPDSANFWGAFRPYLRPEYELPVLSRNGFVVTEQYAAPTFLD